MLRAAKCVADMRADNPGLVMFLSDLESVPAIGRLSLPVPARPFAALPEGVRS